jgi:hypothetical protein
MKYFAAIIVAVIQASSVFATSVCDAVKTECPNGKYCENYRKACAIETGGEATPSVVATRAPEQIQSTTAAELGAASFTGQENSSKDQVVTDKGMATDDALRALGLEVGDGVSPTKRPPGYYVIFEKDGSNWKVAMRTTIRRAWCPRRLSDGRQS